MNEPEWASDVRQEEWSLEMIFRWIEETAAFLHQIQVRNHAAHENDREPHKLG